MPRVTWRATWEEWWDRSHFHPHSECREQHLPKVVQWKTVTRLPPVCSKRVGLSATNMTRSKAVSCSVWKQVGEVERTLYIWNQEAHQLANDLGPWEPWNTDKWHPPAAAWVPWRDVVAHGRVLSRHLGSRRLKATVKCSCGPPEGVERVFDSKPLS